MFDFILLFHWTELLQPQWYIDNGGLWFIVFAVFAETGLFAGFFLPGDSLLFVTGIFSDNLVKTAFGIDLQSSFLNLFLLGVVISLAGVVGNFAGYWFGQKYYPIPYQLPIILTTLLVSVGPITFLPHLFPNIHHGVYWILVPIYFGVLYIIEKRFARKLSA